MGRDVARLGNVFFYVIVRTRVLLFEVGSILLREAEIVYKLKVFISSAVDNEGENLFSKMRKRVKDELESMGIFNVYIYEEGFGTSKNVVDDYLDEIADSHVCLFLINSADGVPDGVQKEIDEARKLNKPQIYIFNHENAKGETALEKELKSPQGSRIKIVDLFNEFYNESIESIKSEVVKIYKDYSSGRLINGKIDEGHSSVELNLSLTGKHLEKAYIAGFSETRKSICSFFDTEDRSFGGNLSNNLDKYTKSFFDILIGKKNITEFNTTFFLDALKDWHEADVYEVITVRWRAIEYYYAGDLNRCIENLKVAYEKAKSKKLSPWLIQDILIDLRNKIAMEYNNRNEFEINPIYQEKLMNTKEILSYPVLDRLDKQLLNRIEKKRKDELFKKAHSTTYDNILSEYADILNSIYIVAAHYGSLTHLEMMINRIQEVYLHLVETYSNWKFKLNLLKVTVYLTKKKDLERILRKYNNIYAYINSKDVISIMEFSNKNPNEITQKQNELLILTYLGYYLDNVTFTEKQKEIDIEFKQWLDNPIGNISLGEFYFNYFKGNIERLEQDKVTEYVIDVLSRPMARFYDKAFELLKEVDFEKVNQLVIGKLLEVITKKLEGNKLNQFQHLRITFVKMYRSAKLKTEIDNLARAYLSGKEKDLYFGEVGEGNENHYKLFKNSIRSLQASNDEANNGTVYSQSGYNYCSIIKFALTHIQVLSAEDVEELLDVLVRIVINDNQSSDSKVGAFKLIVYLKNNDSRFSNMDLYYEEVIKHDRNILPVRESLMLNHSPLIIGFNYFLFKSIFNKGEETKYQFISSLVNADLTERLEISKSIRNYLYGSSSDINSIVVQMLFILKSDLDEQVRANTTFGLIYLIQNTKNEDILIELSKMMDSETTLIKNIILRNVEKIKDINPEIVQYIMQKGKLDSHYLIREQAQIDPLL